MQLKFSVLLGLSWLADAAVLPSARSVVSDIQSRATSGYRSVAYFVDWAIYARNFQPQNLDTSTLTHVLYAFANINSGTGAVTLADTYADLQKHYSTDSWNDVGNNVYGCIKQLFLLKQKNRNLKVLLSIGGWTYSPNFSGATSTDANRQTFVSTAVEFVKDLGLDGIDIDWEYPASSTEAANYVTLLSELRSALDAYAAQYAPGQHLLISAAVPAGPANYQQLDISGMDAYLDMWNLMAYDYSGSWDTIAGHDANVYSSSNNPSSTPFNTDQAISYYIQNGATASKINLGIPLYGRAFTNTDGPGTNFSGVGSGSWDNGIWDYKVLPQAGATVTELPSIVAAYSYDATQRTMISFDTPSIVQLKGGYVVSNGLGGGMYWDSSSDRNDSTSLVTNFVNSIGGAAAFEQSTNLISYPGSVYDNLRAGFPSG